MSDVLIDAVFTVSILVGGVYLTLKAWNLLSSRNKSGGKESV